MTPRPHQICAINVGFELESLLHMAQEPPKRRQLVEWQRHRHYDEIVENVNRELEILGSMERMRVNKNKENKGPEGYTKWIIEQDSSITIPMSEKKTKYLVPAEIISPILAHNQNQSWIASFENISSALHRSGYYIYGNSCGTHVHFSPEGGKWTEEHLAELKRLALAIVWFEPALEVISPEPRRCNAYVQSNWADNAKFYKKPVPWALYYIEKTTKLEKLVELMNTGADEDEPVERNFAWNFTNLLDDDDEKEHTDKIRTIEFRKPPQTRTASDVKPWVNFTAYFARASIGLDGAEELRKQYPDRSVENLQSFLTSGMPPDLNFDEYFPKLFTGHLGTMLVKRGDGKPTQQNNMTEIEDAAIDMSQEISTSDVEVETDEDMDKEEEMDDDEETGDETDEEEETCDGMDTEGDEDKESKDVTLNIDKKETPKDNRDDNDGDRDIT